MPNYFATTAKGIEAVTAAELTRLGAQAVEPGFGGVAFQGDLEVLYRANLWLRTATRVLMPLREFAAATPEMLYDQVRRIKWETWLDPSKTFAVDCSIAGQKSRQIDRRAREENQPRRRGQLPGPRLASPAASSYRADQDRPDGPSGRNGSPQGLTHSHYVALKIKDAIVDQLRHKQGARPNIDTENPHVRIFAYIRGTRCILSIDASGASLHERGYRVDGGAAPLKETLAAAIVELSGWNPETPFIDPMCGSGTLPLEAALRSLDIAPGLLRDQFGFFGWPDFDEELWTRLVEEARGRAKARPAAPIVGYDRDRMAIATAIDNAKRCHLSRAVHFERRDLTEFEPVGVRPGVLVVNPPYGERLGADTELAGLYELLGDTFKKRLKGWNAFIFTGNLELAKSVGLKASRRMELYNGPIECRLLKYEMY